MIYTGHLIQTMTVFMPWDSSLVDDRGRIIAKSPTIDLDLDFSG
jgi:hypothetical protein